MRSEATSARDEPSSSPPVAESVPVCRIDRRAIIRGAGAVLLAGSLAGCYHEDDSGGGDGDDDDGGGGPYSADDPPVPTR